MQLKSNKLFPHPVLWEEKDDFKNNDAFSMAVSYSTSSRKTDLSILIELKNKQLISMIGNVAFVACHIECPTTKYRNSFILNIGENTITIPSNELNGKVEIVSMIQTNTRLDAYSNEDFNDFYEGITFDIEPYSILAISPQYKIDIEKENENLSNVSSIVSVIPDPENKKAMTISCENPNKIYIKLPQKAYLHYSGLSKNETYNELIFSLLIVPALIDVFDYLIKVEDLDIFEDYRWFRGLSKKVKQITNCDLTIDFLKKSDLIALSQKILSNPIDDAFDIITYIR